MFKLLKDALDGLPSPGSQPNNYGEEMEHLDRIWTKLNTRIEALNDGVIPYGKAETRH